jgi:DNA repair protein RadC
MVIPRGIYNLAKADISSTEKIKVAAQAIDIQFLDHTIVSEKRLI